MEEKKNVKVTIDGKTFVLFGEEDEEYLKKVSEYVNTRLEEIKKAEGFTRLNKDYQMLMIYLNLADDYFKIHEESGAAVRVDALEDEVYQLKCELVDRQVAKEEQDKEHAAIVQQLEESKRDFSFLQGEAQTKLAAADEENEHLLKEKTQLQERLTVFNTKFRELEKTLKEKEEQILTLKKEDELHQEETLNALIEVEECKKELAKYKTGEINGQK